MKKKTNSKFKSALLGTAAVATAFLMGVTAACSKKEETTETPATDDKDTVVTREDKQDIKNGNFEYYDDNDGLIPINTPDNWTYSTNGNSSTSMSGIIKTDKAGWDYLTDPSLPQKLEDNDDLTSDDENKVDYNGALKDDMLYKNSHDALKTDATDEQKEYIENPNTHNLRWDKEKNKYVYTNDEGAEADVYEHEGKLYSDEEHKNEIGTSVLMLHNYRSSNYYGTESYYKSSTTLTLEANTACKISLWVKTSNLSFGGAKAEYTPVTNERGAYIKVDTKVGGNSLDSFMINNIITENLNPDVKDGDGNVTTPAANNGWVQYTLYVEASTFADTTLNLTLGLGRDSVYTCEGYAFFDDITYEKYLNIGELEENNADFASKIRATDDGDVLSNTCYPLSPDAKTEFRVDTKKYTTNNEDPTDTANPTVTETVPTNKEDRHFFINLASSSAGTVALSTDNVTGGLTVDKDRYACANNDGTNVFKTNLSPSYTGNTPYIPKALGATGLDVSSDFIVTTTIKSDSWTFPAEVGDYYKTYLSEQLKSAASLPGVSGQTDALVIMSAYGAAYEAIITDDVNFTVANDGYKLISFWVKTADMSGKTAITVTAVDSDDEDKSSSFNVDSTTVSKVNIGDNKDVYDGWVRCFVRVSNTSKEETAKKFKLKVNFGNTAIKGTTENSFKEGWAALANVTIMDMDEDVYGYTSGVARSATLTYTETAENNAHQFDTAKDEQIITNDLATPTKYTGVNGASINVAPTGESATDYDKTNDNEFAGLLNKDHVANYADKAWYTKLAAKATSNTPTEVWDELIGKTTVQPLLIVNTVRTYSEGAGKIYNYGFYSTDSVSTDSYKAISVNVKVSAGAVAYVYLVEDGENRNVMNYGLPEYNFWYDDDGNILKGKPDENAKKDEQKANIAYTLRKDGLYENGDGKLYANFKNLKKSYWYSEFETSSFYDENGDPVDYSDLNGMTGKDLYASSTDKTKYAPHYLIAGDDANSKIYKYVEGTGNEATYYYVEDGKANTSKVVHLVSTDSATPRYTYENNPYMFIIDARTTEGAAKYANRWIKVTFNIHTGNEAKNYRLELWSGERDKQTSENVTDGSYVMFDYSSASLTQSTFDNNLGEYTNDVINEYNERLNTARPDEKANISDLEKLYGSDTDQSKMDEICNNLNFKYRADYYTFSLYDSPDFIPFNGETAEEGAEGYDFSYSDSEEKLAVFTVEDYGDPDYVTMSSFIDYSVKDQDAEIIGVPTVPDTSTDTGDETEETETPADQKANAWLLAASIALIVAIFIAIIAIFLKDFLKKHSKTKHASKNSYNFKKNKRYVKKYVKANGEAPVVTDDSIDESLLRDGKEVEDGETEETTEEVEETKPEESAAEETKPEESTEAEQAEQTESEETPEDKPADGETPDDKNDGEDK